MKPFEFHGELFELRRIVVESLAEEGYVWPTHYGSVNLQHDVYGLEVTAIHDQTEAEAIEELLRKILPKWRHARTFYEDHNVGELGWKIMISRNPEIDEDASPSYRRLFPVFESSHPWYVKIAAASAYGLIIAGLSVIVGLDDISRAEIVATLIALPIFFALAAAILVTAEMVRRRR